MRLKMLVLVSVAIGSMAILTYINLLHIRDGTSTWSSSGSASVAVTGDQLERDGATAR